MTDTTSKQYKIYLTPKISEFVYGTEIQVSAEIIYNGIKTMKKSIDSSDYEVGVYTYGDISLKLINKNGKYNDETDGRSIFEYTRDLAKIRVVYSDNNGDITRFNGLINEEATKQDLEKEEITFRVLSNDSVIRTTKVSSGVIVDGVLASSAIKTVLNQTKIVSDLNYDASNIAVDYDFTIDDGSQFDNKNARKALNDLLVATNSVLLIDSSDNMVVQARTVESVSVLNLFGPYDLKNRQNIHNVKKYNQGRHRTFTAVKIGNIEVDDDGYVADYGYRQLKKTLAFFTDKETQSEIATINLNEFKRPFIELTVEVPTHIVKNSKLLDPVSLDYPLRVKRMEDKFLPIVGVTKIDDTEMVLPYTFGNKDIRPDVAFKIIEIAENPTKFSTILKLRQYGYFTDPGSSLVGFARIGESTIGGAGTACDQFEIAYIGGAKVGCTEVV